MMKFSVNYFSLFLHQVPQTRQGIAIYTFSYFWKIHRIFSCLKYGFLKY